MKNALASYIKIIMKNQYSSTILSVNLDAVAANYSILKSKAPNAKVSAVVKANAYGLGIAEIVSVLVRNGCDAFFVANLDEAIALRLIQPDVNIFVLHGIFSGQEDVFFAYRIIPVLNSMHQINIWQKYAIPARI
ncbi:MAG: alanine racemase [Pseudomonadota bacterium]